MHNWVTWLNSISVGLELRTKSIDHSKSRLKLRGVRLEIFH